MNARKDRKLRMCMTFYRSPYRFQTEAGVTAYLYCYHVINRRYGERTNKP